MRSITFWMTATVFCCGSCLGLASDVAQEPSNVRFTFEVTQTDGPSGVSSQTYDLVASANGSASTMLGSRVPIPTQNAKLPGDGIGQPRQVTSYSYQDVGFIARVEVRTMEDARINASGFVEISSILDDDQLEDKSEPPVVEAMRHRFDVLAKDGESILLLQVEGRASNGLTIELRIAYRE